MINLPNSCTCSNLTVHPKNWQTKNAKTSVDWYIMYRFYDCNHAKPKLVILKGMNHFKNHSDRQKGTKIILSSELNKLLNEGFNPFLSAKKVSQITGVLRPETPILEALNSVFEKVEVSTRTKQDLKFMLSNVGKALTLLGLINYPNFGEGFSDYKIILILLWFN